MTLETYIHSWSGDGYRNIPADSPLPPLDFRFAGYGQANRWNYPGEPTLYLASDAGLATAEFARHISSECHPGMAVLPLRRRLVRLRLELEAVLGFCDPDAWQSLGGLKDAPNCFLDRAIARAAARYVRTSTPAVAMRVPSVASLDDLSRFTLVVFLDKLPNDPRAFVTDVDDAGIIHIGL